MVLPEINNIPAEKTELSFEDGTTKQKEVDPLDFPQSIHQNNRWLLLTYVLQFDFSF